jgi:hypothetical protein
MARQIGSLVHITCLPLTILSAGTRANISQSTCTMSTTIRKQAPRPARPAGRYWKGKAPKGAADLSSSDESDDGREAPQEEGDVAFAGEQAFLHAEYDGDEEEEQGRKGQRTGTMSVALKNVNISKEGKVLIDGRQEVGRTEMEGALSCPPPRSLPAITTII